MSIGVDRARRRTKRRAKRCFFFFQIVNCLSSSSSSFWSAHRTYVFVSVCAACVWVYACWRVCYMRAQTFFCVPACIEIKDQNNNFSLFITKEMLTTFGRVFRLRFDLDWFCFIRCISAVLSWPFVYAVQWIQILSCICMFNEYKVDRFNIGPLRMFGNWINWVRTFVYAYMRVFAAFMWVYSAGPITNGQLC